jgi:hypothetical protein
MKWEFHFEGGPNDGDIWPFDQTPTVTPIIRGKHGSVYRLQEPLLECCCTRYANYLYDRQGANDVS